ncbi:hypothetical protein EZJ43_09035 [Pedobacter changchengzhani]|uniref:Nitrogen fixation protein FixH n=1 Tax=Pedobacter changchengzhani TaxID=2529274 RepID=A0A4R5MLK3_9SPHI|nr:FixH family protein [Pedobacter changchengzhani]TDG36637.1 hypothetical protein EZJ43_09035 [Pedobacter changchengzhani]
MNWGTKIVMGMLAFILFITAMVVYMFAVHDKDPLIEENYYEKGINYNADYNALQNVIKDNASPKITVTANQIIIQLKEKGTYKLVLMRPSSSADDVKINGTTAGDNNLIVVDKSKLAKGRWFLNLQWQSQEKDYLFKENISL